MPTFFLSVLLVVLGVKMREATHEVTRGHHFTPCDDGVDQLVCPSDRQCIHKRKVGHFILLVMLQLMRFA